MPNKLEKFIQKEYTNRDIPDFKVGDVVRVHHIVPEIKGEVQLSKAAKAIKRLREQATAERGGERLQVFEGTIIAHKHGREPGATITVRKIGVGNIGIEKIFPLYSPLITKLEVVSRPDKRVRRSKLYFLRNRTGKKARKFGVGSAVEQQVTRVSQLEDDATEAEVEEGEEETGGRSATADSQSENKGDADNNEEQKENKEVTQDTEETEE